MDEEKDDDDGGGGGGEVEGEHEDELEKAWNLDCDINQIRDDEFIKMATRRLK